MNPSAPSSLRVLVTGASGLIGRALVPQLEAVGHRVLRAVRRPARKEGEVEWHPGGRRLDLSAAGGCDAIVHLAGQNVAEGRWTAARRWTILSSRVEGTRTLRDAVEQLPPAQRPHVFVAASGVGIYGAQVSGEVDETARPGEGFLADVCRAWEGEVGRMAELGVREVRLRLGVVLAAEGGALAKLLPIMRLGLGGPVGGGGQWMSWIALDDAVGAIRHALLSPGLSGPVNAVAPEPVTNAEFVRTLGRLLGKSARLHTPALALRALYGDMADETILASQRAIPRRLQAEGFRFIHPRIEDALRSALGLPPEDDKTTNNREMLTK